MADKKFVHVTLVIEEQILRDLEFEAGLVTAMGNAGGEGPIHPFVCKLVREWKEGHFDQPVRIEYTERRDA